MVPKSICHSAEFQYQYGVLRSGVWPELSAGCSFSCRSGTAHLVPTDLGSLTLRKHLCRELRRNYFSFCIILKIAFEVNS